MTVQEIFELRKQGQVAQAWEAIQPMFAVHKGHYTSIAYFWLASDSLKSALEAKNADAARQLLFKMTQAYPYIEDADGRARQAIIKGALKVDSLMEQFNLAYFMPYFEKMNDDDWRAQKVNDHWLPSLGERVISHLFRDFEQRSDAEYVARIVPLLGTALKHRPNDKNYLRILARLYQMEGQRDKAEEVLRRIIVKNKDAAACHALSELTKDPAERIALLCQAILWQPQEKFRSRMRVELASLLIDKRPANALFELQRSRATRTAMGNHMPEKALQMERRLQSVSPVTEEQEYDFYRRALGYLHSKG